MFDSMTPNANVCFYTHTEALANATCSRRCVTALTPLMVKLCRCRVGLLGNDIFAFGFAQLQITADTVDDNPAFLTLNHIAAEPRTN
jgi:hypothetical protein